MERPVARHAAISAGPALANRPTAIGSGPPRHARASARARLRKTKSVAGIAPAGALVIALAILSVTWLTDWSTSAEVSSPTLQRASAVAEPPPRVVPSQASSRASTNSVTTTVGGISTNAEGSAMESTIQLDELVGSGRPYQAVPIRGTQSDGPNSLLQVQRREGQEWVSFPVPTMTDQSGDFTTYVELAKPGGYWLRVLNPRSGATSVPRFLVIEG